MLLLRKTKQLWFINIHRCHWQNHHNSAKTFAITTNIGTKLLNGYKLKVNKNGVHSNKHFCKYLKIVDGGAINADMTPPQFLKFKTDCNIFKRFFNIPENQLYAQLYSSCDDYVQKSLANAFNDFLPSLKSNYSKHSKPLLPKNSTVPYIAFILAP